MDGSALGLIELILVFGGVLGFAFWELYSLRKYKDTDKAGREAARKNDDNGTPNA